MCIRDRGLGLPPFSQDFFDFIGPTLYPVIQSPGRICCVVQWQCSMRHGISLSQQLTKVKWCKMMKEKSASQLQSALPLCWDNPFVFVSSEHHHSTSQTWSQQHSMYWLYLIFLIFNYQTPHKVYYVCTESWEIPGHTFYHHSPGRHYWSLSAPPASLSTVCTESPGSNPVIPVTILDPLDPVCC